MLYCLASRICYRLFQGAVSHSCLFLAAQIFLPCMMSWLSHQPDLAVVGASIRNKTPIASPARAFYSFSAYFWYVLETIQFNDTFHFQVQCHINPWQGP